MNILSIFFLTVILLLDWALSQFRFDPKLIDFDPRIINLNLTLVGQATTTTAPGSPMPTAAPPPPPELFFVGADGALKQGFYPGQLVRFRLQSAAPQVLFSQHFVRLFFGGFEAPVFFASDVPLTT
jgi:hypothetical protein